MRFVRRGRGHSRDRGRGVPSQIRGDGGHGSAGPLPDPWKRIRSAEQVEIAHVLARLSGFTMSKEFDADLKSLATEIARGAAGKLAADFEDCGTVAAHLIFQNQKALVKP